MTDQRRIGRISRKSTEQRRLELEEELTGLLSRRQLLVRAGLAAVGASSLVSLLAACGDDSGNAAGPQQSQENTEWPADRVREKYGNTTIGDSWHTLALSIIADRARGGEVAAKALGQTYKGFGNDVNTANQISDVQNALNSGMKVINTVPIDAPVVSNLAEVAERAEAKFTTTYNSPAWKTPLEYGSHYLTYFAPDDYQTGRTTALKLAEHLEGKGAIVLLEGVEGATANVLRTKGVNDALKDFPGIEMAAQVATDWTTVDAQRKMQNLLNTVPQIDGVIGNDDDIGIGAHNAIRAAGQEIPIVSSDGIEQAFRLIDESFYLGTVNTFTHWVGGYAFVRAFDALQGWKPKPAETMMYTQTSWVDKTNAAAVRKAFYGPTLPYNFARMSQVLYPEDWDTQQLLTPMDPELLWSPISEKPAGYELPEGYGAEEREKSAALYENHWATREFK